MRFSIPPAQKAPRPTKTSPAAKWTAIFIFVIFGLHVANHYIEQNEAIAPCSYGSCGSGVIGKKN